MTEYESWEVLNGLVANLMQQQTLFVDAFTAYVVAAHLVGTSPGALSVCVFSHPRCAFLYVADQASQD